MRKVINGLPYDTKTAEKLTENSYSNPRDFNWYEETLYRKRTGEYFLYYEGNANSPYSKRINSNTWGGDQGIRPLTVLEAQRWAEKACDGDEYEKIFGKIEEKRMQVSGWVSKEDKNAAEKLKKTRGIQFSDIYSAGINALKDKAE